MDSDDSGSLDPEEAFSLLGNDTRASILLALGDAFAGEGPAEPLPFSTLRERVDGVDSGQFNYHHQQLLGTFVVQHDDGYRLGGPGLRVYRAILAGTFERSDSIDPFELDRKCDFRGGSVVASYGSGSFSVWCDDCEYVYLVIEAPPHVVETSDREQLIDRVDRYHRHLILAFASGVCPYCADGVSIQILPLEAVSYTSIERREVLIYRACEHCHAHIYLTVGGVVLYHPEVISFCYERGSRRHPAATVGSAVRHDRPASDRRVARSMEARIADRSRR